MQLPAGSEAPPRRRRIRKLRLAALVTVLLVLAGAAFTFGLTRAIAGEIPELDPSRQRSSKEIDSVLYASNGRSVLGVLRGAEARVLLQSIEDVAPIMRQAIVAVEDHRFYEHAGIDLRGIARALWQDVRQQDVVEGGSTITQQFVKNAYIRNERTLARKVREAALAWQLEQQWSKDRILLSYLNTIYFGNGAYGIQQAARTYFKKGASELELHEAALLAGVPADPASYDPVQRPRAAKERRRYVLQTLVDQGKITRAQLAEANNKPLPRPEDVRLPGTRGPAPYFVNYVTDQLVGELGAGRVYGGGLRVTTTIDLELQDVARRAIESVLRDPDGPAAALVAIEPATGAVRAMFGGTSYRRSQFNLAAQSARQPGSAFKPIVLATAMRQGISPATTLESKPIEIQAGDRVWNVSNYEDTYLGRVDLANAMVSSDNSVYAQLTKIVGPAGIVETAGELGVASKLSPWFSIGLGALAVSPLDMARAYATFANRGARVDGSTIGSGPRAVERIERVRDAKVTENAPVPHSVLRAEEADLLTTVLEDVVQQGTGRRAALPDRVAAGKTGTTDNYGDAWFVGYTPQLAVAVWVGYPDELRPMETEFDGEPVTGGTLPAQIWRAFMTKAHARLGIEPAAFAPTPYLPATERRVAYRGGRYRLDNGYCPNTRVLAYFADRVPDATANCRPNEVTVPSVVGQSVDAGQETLRSVPLTSRIVYKPAVAGKQPGLIVRQYPAAGFLSAGDSVTLVVSKAEHGLVPNLVGSSSTSAVALARSRGLRPEVELRAGPAGTVLRQSVEPGVSAARGMRITLVVGRG